MAVLPTSVQNLKKLVKASVTQQGAEICDVVSVDLTNLTINVVSQRNKRNYPEVSLVSIKGEMESIVCVPEVDSSVLVIRTEDNEKFIALTGKLAQIISNAPSIVNNIVDEFIVTDNEDLEYKLTPDNGLELTMSDVEYKVNNDGMKLTVGSDNMHSFITDLLTYLEQLTVNTPNGPSSPPINVADFTALKTKANNLFQ